MTSAIFDLSSGDTAPQPPWTEAMFRGLAENLVVGIYLLEEGRFRYVNERMVQMLGYSRTVLLGKSLQELVPADEHQLVREKIRQTLQAENGKVHYERRAKRHDGSLFDVEVFGSSFTWNGKQFIAAVMVDVSDRKSIEAEAHFSSMMYHRSSQAMVVTNPNGVILTVNPAFTDITGYSLDEVLGQRLNVLSSGRHDAAFYKEMWRSLTENGTWEGEVWNRRKNGEIYIERLSITTTYSDKGTPRCRIGLFSDVTEHKKAQEHIWRQARHDHLTGLPNRYLFNECLASKLDYAERAKTGLVLLYLDLDFFKEVNDTLGHAWGDELLRQVAARLSKCVRKTDLVARLGGDEFCIIADGLATDTEIEALCKKVAQTIAEPYPLGESQGTVSASIGASVYPRDAVEADDLIHNADLAMYAAKRRGPSEYALYDSSMRRDALFRSELSRDLAEALEKEQLRLYYQPIYDLKTRAVCKVEALLRWEHPQKGMLRPIQFLPQAEDSGLIVDIGEWVFRQATQMLQHWRKEYSPHLRLALNVSPVQLMDKRMQPHGWLEQLDTLGLPHDCIVLEITESLLLEMDPVVSEKLQVFRSAGMSVALDDFCTGYSSVAHLKRLHIDYVKIDHSFIHQVEIREDQRALCDAIIMMAHRLGLEVVAEGISSATQYEFLLQMGCDYGQGVHFFGAMPAVQIDKLLKE
ncbi:EAL domain-containing protein [Pusillimonas sp. CC-YST705]|uniref:EAL domain-containing protein n=1 Tax=Mesopusillimonas faecipullorum TaxID=2755040 RepID=A0ABS8CGD9_9BURK|nr:EAL domain-containing protein [Mesopusillimonas faecipullorum]MCB5364614.1 EAL domain-containing protein [Mesopusillimonas faecipullorum]